MGRRNTALCAIRATASMSRRHSGGTVKAIHRRDRTCWLCGWDVPEAEASRDHSTPKSHGGYDKAANYRLAHRLCNSARGDLPVDRVVKVLHVIEPGARPHVVREALWAAQQEWMRDPDRARSIGRAQQEGSLVSEEWTALRRAAERRERWERHQMTPNQKRLDQLLDGFARRKRRRR